MIKQELLEFSKLFLQKIESKNIHIISRIDSNGITSACILTKTLNRINKTFSLKIIKELNSKEIKSFPKDKLIILLDLGSSSFEELEEINNQIIIIDNHSLSSTKIPNNITIFNPNLFSDNFELCSAELTYLLSKEISSTNIDLAFLAIIGMVASNLEKNSNIIHNEIINDSEVKIKKGLLIYPSTRPIDRALEYSSHPFIPGVTGDQKGTSELLKEANIERIDNSYKALIDFDENEMKRLISSVALRLSAKENSEFIGNLFLIKFFNKIEDARELSAIINACGRMNKPEIAIMLCLGNNDARKKAEKIYFKYRQHIISGLRFIDKNQKIYGKEYVIINAKDKIKDSIIGTIASILSFSSIYKEGTIIIAMAYNSDKIKVSTRMVGKNHARNLRDLMDSITCLIGGESGGNKEAAGCLIDKINEDKFIELLKKKLEYELVKV